MERPQAIFFDVDGLLITTGGAGTSSWRWAFNEQAGFLLGITTGAVEAAAHIKLARANLNRFFSFGGYGSDSAERGELTGKAIERAGRILGIELDSHSVLVLGDTPKDISAAHAAGAIGVGVASGQYSKAELRDAGADYVLASLEEELPGVAEVVP